MHQFLMLPILFPLAAGTGLLIVHAKDKIIRNVYVMAAVLITAALSMTGIVLSATRGGDALTCTLVRFSQNFSISLRIDGASIVYGIIVSLLWPLVTLYALEYMSHEKHRSRFFGFWIISFGVALGIAFSEDFLSLYLFYELLTLSTLPLVMHTMDSVSSS